MKICNGLQPKIPFQTPKLITRMIMSWDAHVRQRSTFGESKNKLKNYHNDYNDYLKGKNKDSEIGIQIKKLKNFHLPKPRNDENLEGTKN
ncbi:hypothetical protein Glove_318g40 [Diversispora epigaea]|uniref:Uncharacterized protein n=1 Tax=Diversispora epigaea TaxID=1348612 RepID=A0A397HQS8_9GLOM|nr:hypothetical protein Glove_318g40 [Diversispora epigaea]